MLFAVAAIVATTGCESTQSKSKRLAREGGTVLDEKGVVVRHQSSKVKVLSTEVLHDQNGTAAVIEMRNVSKDALVQVPVSIDVRSSGGRSLFRNNQPGLETALTHAPLLSPGKEFFWVNDQIDSGARPRSVKAKVGEARPSGKRQMPDIVLSRPKLETDPVSGTAAVGFASNRSKIEQRDLVIFAIARKGGRIVAAGRGQIKRAKPSKRARFQIFFIGDPRGAKLALAAPPTRLG
jgi:hypothetical protein